MDSYPLVQPIVLFDQFGNPVSVEQRNGRYVIAENAPEANALLERVATAIEDLRDQTILRPSFVSQGATKLVGNDSSSVNYVAPDGAQAVMPRTILMPPIVGLYSFSTSVFVAATTGVGNGLSANSTIYAFRNPGPYTMGVTHIDVTAVETVTFAAAQQMFISLFLARQWTGPDTGGVASVVGTSGRKRSTYPPSTLDLRVASPFTPGDPGKVIPGTRVTDPGNTAQVGMWIPAAQGNLLIETNLYDHGDMTHGPLIFGPNEGFVINTAVAIPNAAGTFVLNVNVDWFETPVWY